MKLIFPTSIDKKRFLEYLEEYPANGDKSELAPLGLLDFTSWEDWFAGVHVNLYKIDGPSSTTLFACQYKRIFGVVRIFHQLSQPDTGGHIYYSLRPTLQDDVFIHAKVVTYALKRCRVMGIGTAYMTCNTTDVNRANAIVQRGGVYEKTFQDENGHMVARYSFTFAVTRTDELRSGYGILYGK